MIVTAFELLEVGDRLRYRTWSRDGPPCAPAPPPRSESGCSSPAGRSAAPGESPCRSGPRSRSSCIAAVAQRAGHVLLIQYQQRDQVAVAQRRLRLVDLQVAVDEPEHVAVVRLVPRSLSRSATSVVAMTNCTGSPNAPGVELERAHLRAGGASSSICSAAPPGIRAARALVPGFEHHAAEPLVDARIAGDLEHLRILGQLARDVEHLARVAEHLVGGRIRRAGHLAGNDAQVAWGPVRSGRETTAARPSRPAPARSPAGCRARARSRCAPGRTGGRYTVGDRLLSRMRAAEHTTAKASAR